MIRFSNFKNTFIYEISLALAQQSSITKIFLNGRELSVTFVTVEYFNFFVFTTTENSLIIVWKLYLSKVVKTVVSFRKDIRLGFQKKGNPLLTQIWLKAFCIQLKILILHKKKIVIYIFDPFWHQILQKYKVFEVLKKIQNFFKSNTFRSRGCTYTQEATKQLAYKTRNVGC